MVQENLVKLLEGILHVPSSRINTEETVGLLRKLPCGALRRGLGGAELVPAAVHPAESLELPGGALLEQEHDLPRIVRIESQRQHPRTSVGGALTLLPCAVLLWQDDRLDRRRDASQRQRRERSVLLFRVHRLYL